ncbi:acyl-CoA dehydrogenase family protein [Rhodococcus sp. USK13]|uniref:acyl-CoA dehydrogenase family protein n=1 Tax=Rhodococcus sp. USK13 TaxID=2806442 RepID=UPI001BD17A8C|nr:acyl-CoA dehydrogenase family protein [Rhodococcus sp. USK13]
MSAVTLPEAELRSRLRAFVDDHLIPAEPELNRLDASWHRSPLLHDLQAKAKAEGLWALGHPAEIGGGGLDFLPYARLNETIGRSDWGQRVFGTATLQDALMLQRFANPELRDRWLPPLVAGEIHPSVGLTEPDVAGSDPRLMQTSAVRDGDDWIISGRKWFTTHANRAAFTTVFCRTGGTADTPEFSAILVPTDTPGYTVVRVLETMGKTSGGHSEILLDGVRVPHENVVGETGHGLRIAQARLGPGRIFHCMRWLGQAERAFELMCERAQTRFAHGSLLADKGEVQRHIAESAIELQSARLLVLDAARVLDTGAKARVEISMAKVAAAHMFHNVVDRAIQVFGAAGVTSDLPLDRMYREARFGRILDGADEVHRMVISRHLLRDYDGQAPWMQSLDARTGHLDETKENLP